MDAANLANRIPPDDAVSHRYLDNIRTLPDSSVNAIRNIALLLRPSMLDDLGLIPALEWQAREVSRRSGIKVKVTAENVPDSLPDALRTCVYRVVQEALHNVSRHSRRVEMRARSMCARQTGHALMLTVEDDGSGFRPGNERAGLGLAGHGGTGQATRRTPGDPIAAGQGNTLRVTLPIAGATE